MRRDPTTLYVPLRTPRKSEAKLRLPEGVCTLVWNGRDDRGA